MKRLRTKERGWNVPPWPSGGLAAMVLSNTPSQAAHRTSVLEQEKPGCPFVTVHAPQLLPGHRAKRGITSARAYPLARHGLLLGRDAWPTPSLGPTDNKR